MDYYCNAMCHSILKIFTNWPILCQYSVTVLLYSPNNLQFLWLIPSHLVNYDYNIENNSILVRSKHQALRGYLLIIFTQL